MRWTRRASLIRFQTVLLSVGLSSIFDEQANAQFVSAERQPNTKSVMHRTARENSPTTSLVTKADARTTETAGRWGIKAVFVGQGLVVSSCETPCKASQAELLVTVPSEALSTPRTVKVLQLKGGEQALWIRYGSTEEHYSLIILGGVRTQADQIPGAISPPEVVFRGFSSPAGAKLSLHETKEGAAVYVTSSETKSLCGRNIPSSTQRLDAATGKFQLVKLSPLGASERNAAQVLKPTPATLKDTDLLLQLTSDTLSAPTDGQRDQVWTTAYDAVSLRFNTKQSQEDLVFEFKEPLGEAVTLQLASESSVWTLQFEPFEGTTYALPRPPEAQCLALVHAVRPVGLVEVMGRINLEPPATVAGLVAQLETDEYSRSQRALALLGTPALSALLTAYPRLSPAGQVRALTIAERAPFGAPLLVLGLDLGPNAGYERSHAALIARKTAGRDALIDRLASDRVLSPDRLSRTLFEIDPSGGAQVIIKGMESAKPELRASYQKTFRSLFADLKTRPSFESPLFKEGQFERLNRFAQIAILRSLADSYDLANVQMSTLELARSANFREAYLLAPVLAARRSTLAGSTEILRSWLTSSAPSKLEAIERSALVVEILQQLRSPGHTPVGDSFGAVVTPLLASKNMRVRAAAAQFLGDFPHHNAGSALDHALRKDLWPEVRGASAAGLGKLLEPSSSSKLSARDRASWEQALIRRVKRDDESSVRRALLRALSNVPTEAAVIAVRKRFNKDKAYEVRAEAALALGRMCDQQSVNDLTRVARALAQGQVDEGAVTLSLNAVSALAQLDPVDLKARVAPLLAPNVPGLLRARVSAQLTAIGHTCRSQPPQK